ncbi:MAG TPA: aldehyde dehydrogenase family protein [Bryobacteraceae bacterium]|nr:aldehyde dehydrogenase family protein [Bryobacteraceae bacterium]
MLHIPLLRKGEPYRSLDIQTAPHHRTREPFVEVSQANAGLIRRDLRDQHDTRRLLAELSVADLVAICKRAAGYFSNDSLPLGDSMQSPEDYVAQTSATTGLPYPLVRRNMTKIHGMLAEVDSVLAGLTRALDLTVLDTGYAESNGHLLSFFPRGDSLGVILPSNSPGVHSLWIPAIAMKIPLVLKPGSAEPWTPYRIIQALIRAGCPREVFGYYPAGHLAAGEILRLCGRGMLFGDVATARAFANDPRVEIHGPGYSKVLIGEDEIDNWERYLDVIITSIADNSGRSCVNASGVWVPRHAGRIADAIAERLTEIEPLPAEDDRARLAPFADASLAERISATIDQALEEPGAVDVTARRRSPRVAQAHGCTYLLPTIIRCAPEHSLANREFLFPFASVVEVPENQMLDAIGPTLVLTAITNNEHLKERILTSSNAGRLNFGPIPTTRISWDQPHEGNLFDHLYARRAFQRAREAVA